MIVSQVALPGGVVSQTFLVELVLMGCHSKSWRLTRLVVITGALVRSTITATGDIEVWTRYVKLYPLSSFLVRKLSRGLLELHTRWGDQTGMPEYIVTLGGHIAVRDLDVDNLGTLW